MPINDPESLREHIELAIKVEMSTVPPYLYAMYSFVDPASEAALLIRSIVAEEMLHAALATNLLLAVGGSPRFGGTAYMPTYPMHLPHHRPPLLLDLAPCSLDVVEGLFMRIEQPEAREAPAQPDEFETLGQFYHALEQGLVDLTTRYELFAEPAAERQMSNPAFYRPVAGDAEDSGGLMPITDLESAIQAIEIIVHQGEGLSDERWADPAHQELTHYHKLLRIRDGISPLGAIHPLPTNPTVSGYPPDVRLVANLFNACYRAAYLALARTFDGGSGQAGAVGLLYRLMGDLMSPLGRFLSTRPLGGGMNAAPTFEFYEFGETEALAEISAMARQAAIEFPELTPVYESAAAL